MADDDSETWVSLPATTADSLDAVGARFEASGLKSLIEAYEAHSATTGQRIPVKADFDPMTLGRILSYTILYDLRDPDRVLYRLVGEAIKHHFGFDPTGSDYLSYVPERRRAASHQGFRHCAEYPCAMAVRTEQIFETGQHALCEALGLPLLDNPDDRAASFLLFVDQPVDLNRDWSARTREMKYAYLLERCFIDLGHGFPTDFADMIPERMLRRT